MATVKLAKENIKTNNEDLTKSTVVVPVCHDCGCDYGEIISCTKYGSTYGPVYHGELPIDQYPGWAAMIKNGEVTESEKRIIIIMSANEGNMDSVQSYDNQILTAGAMQKTISPTGAGEFPAQVADFKEKHPELYQSLFENCGWTVEGKGPTDRKMYYKDKELTGGNKITAVELKNLLRDSSKFNKKTNSKKEKQESRPLAAIIKALKHEYFLEHQVQDFIKRLRLVMNLKITDGKISGKVSDYLKSELGRATALDQHVNRPAYVTTDIKSAVHAYIAKHPDVKPDPATWGTNHAKIESGVLEIYGNARQGTDMPLRFKKLKAKT
ncbi:hypothetical protein K5M33_10645 [Chromobacterium vaccinii]|nr:hypothetical protein [Chromobacterium vaccinii]MBX9357179.1 hypothetical protein [Chromobacterium vaccinii]